MDPSTRHRHRKSPSSDRFIGIFSLSPPSSTNLGGSSGGDELNEEEVFWTGDFSEPNHHRETTANQFQFYNRLSSYASSDSSGILAALIDGDDNQDHSLRERPVLTRTNSISYASSSRMIPLIPKRPPQSSDARDYSLSAPSRKFHQSAPMNVPVLSKAMAKQRINKEFVDVDIENDDYEMLPPHEIVSRGSGVSPQTTFSVLEGVGRTLKGRDLRQVRNAIWRKTGFLD